MTELSNWNSMGEEERRKTLEEIEKQEAIANNRPPAAVLPKDYPNPSEEGQYRYPANEIDINRKYILEDQPDNALRTLYHEGRHAYQFKEAENPSVADNPEQAQQWRYNLENYKRPEIDMKAYCNQPVEVDARAYAQQKMLEYEKQKSQQQNTNNQPPTQEPGKPSPAVQRYREKEAARQEAIKTHREAHGNTQDHTQGRGK